MRLAAPPHCKLCGDRHWSWEPHKFPKDLEVRPMIGRLLGKVVEGRGRVVEETRAVAVREKTNIRRNESEQVPEIPNIPVEIPNASAGNPNICPGCLKPLPASKTKPKKFHDDACRMKAKRASRGK